MYHIEKNNSNGNKFYGFGQDSFLPGRFVFCARCISVLIIMKLKSKPN